MIYILIILLGLLFIYMFIVYNKLIKLNNEVSNSFSLMDVYLKKRWDLIPSLVTICKEYSKYELKSLEDIIRSRSNYDIMNNEEKINTNEIIDNDINKVILIKEEYPELKANDNYDKLFKELESIENDIANSRKYYNGTVKNYNNLVEMFPINIIAKIFRFKKKKMFLNGEEEKNNIRVDM